MKHHITGNDLLAVGFTEGKMLGLALTMLREQNYNADTLQILLDLKADPESFRDHPVWGPLAAAMIETAQTAADATIALKEQGDTYTIYGADHIEQGARQQMDIAMKLPVTAGGALMPDAHQGYGLPIGGVLATRNAIIPYGVGVDIGCRMALTVFDIPEEHFQANHAQYKRELIAHTKFGAGAGFQGQYKANHEVLDRKEFSMTPFIKQLQDKAYAQLGSSGGGNHFVEWGIIEFAQHDKILNVDAGRYLALLTHSGSRGFGASVAGHYTRLAKELCQLPKEAANLAYLDMNSAAGQEYWLAMNLAGDYASACHEVIHNKLVKAIGGQVLARVENHHNLPGRKSGMAKR
jgi:tRNA-splicing ligase RtcB